MKQNKIRLSVVLLCGLLLTAFTACGKQEDNSYTEDPAPQINTAPAEEETAEETTAKSQADIPVSQTKEDGTSDIHVTIESVEISLSDLQAQDYTVPVYVTLEENAGITYSEWGASFDPRCTMESDSFDEQVRFDTTCSINNDAHFFWTAWSSAATRDKSGNLILLNVHLPEDAAAGDFYFINYASYSLADMPHSWANAERDWALDGYVSWTDGGITVTE